MILSLLLAAHAAEPPASVFTRVMLVDHCDAVGLPDATEKTGVISTDLTLLQAAVAHHPDMHVVSAPSMVTMRGEPGSMSIGAMPPQPTEEVQWSMQVNLDTPTEPASHPVLAWSWQSSWISKADPSTTHNRALSSNLALELDRVTWFTMRPDDPTCPGGHTLFATAYELEGEDGAEDFRAKMVAERDSADARFADLGRRAKRREARTVLAEVGLGSR